MKLCCDCGCRQELAKVYDRSGAWHGQYRWYSSNLEKKKRFLTHQCVSCWEGRRKIAAFTMSDAQLVANAERYFNRRYEWMLRCARRETE